MRNKSFKGLAGTVALSAALLWTMPSQAAEHLTAEQARAAVSGLPKDKIDLSNKDMSGDDLTGLDLSGANLRAPIFPEQTCMARSSSGPISRRRT